MKSYIDIEVERTVSHVVNDSIRKVNGSGFKCNILSGMNKNNNYDFNKINELKNDLSLEIEKIFYGIEKGKDKNVSEYELYDKKRYKYVHRGYLCEISFNSIIGSTLFSNIGPTIPIKIVFIGGTHVNADIKSEEYGINNVIIKTYISFDVINRASMPIGSRDFRTKIKEPVCVNIINGKIPNYYSGLK